MDSLDKAVQTQLNNIQKKTGKTLEELTALIAASGLTKHGEIRDMLKRDLGLGHGDANTLTHIALQSDGARRSGEGAQHRPGGGRDLQWRKGAASSHPRQTDGGD